MITDQGNLIPDRVSAESLIHVMALRSIMIFALAVGNGAWIHHNPRNRSRL